MDRWEYKFVPVFRFLAFETLEQAINDLGRDGWEAVGFAETGKGKGILMKRRLPPSTTSNPFT